MNVCTLHGHLQSLCDMQDETRTLTTIDIGHLLTLLYVTIDATIDVPNSGRIYGCLSETWERSIFTTLVLASLDRWLHWLAVTGGRCTSIEL